MRLLTRLALILAILGLIAVLTRPGPDAFDAMLDRAIRDRVANTDIGSGSGEALPTIALAACKLRPTDCVALVREALDVTFDERVFVTRARVEGFGRTLSCLGVFGRFFCNRPVAG
jgi:hypothetical protein